MASESTDASVETRDETGKPTGGPTVDELFELLARPGNRFTLAYLLDAEEPAMWYELVEHVVEHTDPPTDMSENRFRGRLATQLLRTNIPELVEHDLVEQRQNTILRTTDYTELAEPYLRLAREQER